MNEHPATAKYATDASRPRYSAMIRKARKDMGITVEKMAEFLDVSYTSVIQWENGKVYPDAVRRAMIKDKLGIDLPERSAV
ncbi:MAG: helix-turn-helix transcriptional regulator [Lentisphaeria bacterium]|nr:helix-turn-helix transcriptional regulator [Lentisphaeria bacterium]